MKERVLYQNNRRLTGAPDKIICLTFLTTKHCVWSLVYLLARAYCRIKERFPGVEFYSLSLIKDKKRVSFFDIKISLLPPFELKKLCMELELNADARRRADIDVYILFRHAKKLYKVSRYYL